MLMLDRVPACAGMTANVKIIYYVRHHNCHPALVAGSIFGYRLDSCFRRNDIKNTH